MRLTVMKVVDRRMLILCVCGRSVLLTLSSSNNLWLGLNQDGKSPGDEVGEEDGDK